jgi:DNA end-binding protein Ku
MGTLLRYPYEVRDEKEYFDDIQDVKVTKDRVGNHRSSAKEQAKQLVDGHDVELWQRDRKIAIFERQPE